LILDLIVPTNDTTTIPCAPVEVVTTPAPAYSMKGKKGFQPGHPKLGGRRKGSPLKRTAEAREVAAKLGFHPVEWLVRVAQDGYILNSDGTQMPVDAATRVDAVKAVSRYLLPTLQAVAHINPDSGPKAEDVDINRLLEDPEMVRAAQTLALGIAEAPAILGPGRAESPVTVEVLASKDSDDSTKPCTCRFVVGCKWL
jgi:hypothetical protein